MDNLLVACVIVVGGNEDVVHVDKQFGWVLHPHFPEHTVHGSLEGCRGVGQPKEHYSGFEQAFGCFEGGLPLVSFFNSDIIIPPSYAEFGEEGSSLELF